MLQVKPQIEQNLISGTADFIDISDQVLSDAIQKPILVDKITHVTSRLVWNVCENPDFKERANKLLEFRCVCRFVNKMYVVVC